MLCYSAFLTDICHGTEQGATVTYLLRSTSVFDNDAEMQRYIKEGKAQLVRGDGLNIEDVRNGWQKSLEAGNGKVDAVIFTIGMPIFSLSLSSIAR